MGHADHGGPADRRARHGRGPRHVHRRASCARSRPTPGSWPCGSCTATASSTRATSSAPCATWSTGSRTPRRATSEQMVDVVSLSLGYFSETPHDEAFTSGLWQVIELLLGLGVVVVAAAGNYSTSRRFYPAAFARSRRRRAGAADQRGRAQPERLQGDLQRRRPLDHRVGLRRRRGQHAPDRHQRQPQPRAQDCARTRQPACHRASRCRPAARRSIRTTTRGGFAVWSGTSFSAPLLAAQHRPGAAGGSGGADGLQLDALRGRRTTTEPGAGRPEEHGLAGLIADGRPHSPSRSGRASRTAPRGSRAW